MPFSSPVTGDSAARVDAWFERLWDQTAAAQLAAEAKRSEVPPYPPATLEDIEDAMRAWAARPPGCARTVVLDVLLDIKLRLVKDET